MKHSSSSTRAGLMKYKKKLASAETGHGLLKDKREEIGRRLKETRREISELRDKTDSVLLHARNMIQAAAALIGEEELSERLFADKRAECNVEWENAMGTLLPQFTQISFSEYAKGTSAELFCAVSALEKIKGELFRLAQKEAAAEVLEKEERSAARRVNALEHVLIPEYTGTIRYIKMRIEENERGNLIRILKAEK